MATPVYSANERFVVAATIWGEARDQGNDGMRAVAHVIMNRVAANKPTLFGTTVASVATFHRQFSCWNDGDPNAPCLTQYRLNRIPSDTPDGQAWIQAQYIANDVMQGRDPDLTNGALYYHTTSSKPYWSSDYEKVAILGKHVFYR